MSDMEKVAKGAVKAIYYRDGSPEVHFFDTATNEQRAAVLSELSNPVVMPEIKPPTIEERLAALEAKVFPDATKNR